ncbi:hypothetical protein K438DRAFT_1770153 [Mycena galopus ATCC 62051]|nr:hypothetical protein K438DRAFT_1770153 [Mycena galopus ATCC 62051]
MPLCEEDFELHDLLMSYGSDHLPIHYSLEFVVVQFKSKRFNAAKMDLDVFHAILAAKLEARPVPVISTLELNAAASFINEVLLEALMESTPRHRPSSTAKQWWTEYSALSGYITNILVSITQPFGHFGLILQHDQLTALRKTMHNWWHKFQQTCLLISEAKQAVWTTFLQELEQIDLYRTLNCLKEHVLGQAWFGPKAVNITSSVTPMSPDVTLVTSAGHEGSGDQRK